MAAVYAKHSGKNVEAGIVDVVTSNGRNWVPTVVNPSPTGGGYSLTLFYFHLTMWVVTLGLQATTGFGAGEFLKAGNATGAGFTSSEYTTDPTSMTKTIGTLGGVSCIIGVLLLLAGAAMYDGEAYKEKVWLNTAIQFFTLYGTVATLYIFSKAAEVTSNSFYWLSLFTAGFSIYSQILLYCTSAALEILALPRAFVPSLAVSVQFISALCISDGTFVPSATDAQKLAAWMVPVLTLVAVVLMVGLRRWTRNGAGVSQIGDRPFLRSLVLLPFVISGILSVYKLGFSRITNDETTYLFTFFGMLLNFAIVSVVLMPSAMAANA